MLSRSQRYHHARNVRPGKSQSGARMEMPVLDTSDDDGTVDFLLLSDAEVLKSPTLAKVNSGHQTAVIVLFVVRRPPSPSVFIEMWTAQHVPIQGCETRQRSREIAESATIQPRPPGCSHPTALVLRRDQNVTITPATVTNVLLRIPFQSVMRRPPLWDRNGHCDRRKGVAQHLSCSLLKRVLCT